MTEEIRSDQSPVDEAAGTEPAEKTQTRRQLLKVLAGTGVAAGMLALPNKWTKPVAEVGVLPVHAQGSDPAVPPYSLLRCAATAVIALDDVVSAPTPIVWPDSTLRMMAYITPPDAGVQLRRTVTLNQLGHPSHGVLNQWTGPTGVGGLCLSPDFDLSSVAPAISAGVDRIVVTWSFVDPAVGLGVCSTSIEISEYT